MRAERLCARADLRAAWRAWTGVVLLLALGIGAALSAGAAARRTDTAYARALRAGRAADVNVSVDGTSEPVAARALLGRAVRLPGVETAAVADALTVGVVRDGELDERLDTGSALGLAPEDATFGRVVSRFRVVEGRLARTTAIDEVVITTNVAAVTGWGAGDRVTDVKLFGPGDLDETGNPIPTKGTQLDLHVVGVVRIPEEAITPVEEQDQRIVFTPAFAQAHPDVPFYYLANLRLADGTSGVGRYRTQAARLAADGKTVFVASNNEGLVQAQNANRPLVTGLWVLAAVALGITVLLVAQLMARLFQTGATDQRLLGVFGVTPRQRWTILMGEAATAVLAGAGLAVPVAWLASTLGAVGPARVAEPHPGARFDTLALLGGAALAAVVVVAVVALPAWRLAHRRGTVGAVDDGGPERPSVVADLLARAGASPPVVLGARLALQRGRGRSAVPVRSVLASLVVATVAVTAFLAFRADVDRLTSTPSLYGWNADAEAGVTFGAIPDDAVGPMRATPHLAGLSGVTLGDVTIDGRTVPAVGFDRLEGDLYLTMVHGRAASDASEIVLGAKTLRSIHAHLHDTLTIEVAGERHRVRVVGVATFPSMGQSRFHSTSLGVGAAGTTALVPQNDPGSGGTYNWLLFKFRGSRPDADVAALRATLAKVGCPQPYCVVTDPRPQDINSYSQVRGIPAAVAGLLFALVAATVWLALHAATRRRRTDLLILRAMGLGPRDIGRVLRWQAVLLVAIAVVVGVPLGLVAGRLTWDVFTFHLGIDTAGVVPTVPLAIGAVGLLLLALLVAAVTVLPLRRSTGWSSVPAG